MIELKKLEELQRRLEVLCKEEEVWAAEVKAWGLRVDEVMTRAKAAGILKEDVLS